MKKVLILVLTIFIFQICNGQSSNSVQNNTSSQIDKKLLNFENTTATLELKNTSSTDIKEPTKLTTYEKFVNWISNIGLVRSIWILIFFLWVIYYFKKRTNEFEETHKKE